LGIAGMQVTSVKGNYFSNNLTQANYVAQDRIEFLKNKPIADAALNAGNHPDGTSTISGTVFTRSYNVAIDTPTAGNRTITYRVQWNDGVNHAVTFTTIRSR
jgi:hypothetical protein